MELHRLAVCVIVLSAWAFLAGCGKKEETAPTTAPASSTAPEKPKAVYKPVKVLRASICLNGEWDFAPVTADAQKAAPPKDGWRKVRVPSVWWRAPEAPGAKSNNYEYDLPEDVAKAAAAWYRLSFVIPKEWGDGRRVALEFEGIACRSRVFFNGDAGEENEGGHIPVVVDLTPKAKFGQLNEVDVLAECDSPDRRAAGLWRSVYLRCTPTVSIQSVSIETSVRKKEISLTVWLKNDTEAAHRVVLKNLVREAGTDKVANIFGDREEGLEAGEAKPIEVKRTWADPKLWGFGEYGEPALYMLRTELRAADSGEGATSTLDTLNTRFGYREFWTSGRHFMFNGKPFLIKGDVISPPLTLVNNREFITLLYQAERGANINFLRLDDPTGFAHDTWYEVADEMGMLVEPQSCRQVKKGNEEAAADEPDKPFEALKDEWEKFVKDAGNHPSIVMYNCDNETASQAQDIVSGDVFKWINDLHQTIRNADPARVIEEQGDVQLAAGRNFGIIKELQVFNVHPYGAPLGPVLEEIKKKYDYGNNIPIHVGEIHPGEKDPLAVLPAPAGMLKDKAQVFQAFKGAGDYFAASAKGVNEVGAAGMSLMSGFGTMYFGPKSAEEMQFGPWDVRATDEAPGAKGKLVNCVFVKPRWPSLSGEGMKVCWMDASTNPRGSGNEFNWFDPTRPAYLTNITYDLVKKGFHDLDGKDVAPLAGKRAGEVVVGLAPDGKPLAGAYVFLTKKGQELMGDTGVMTDAAGTAWFTPEEPGDYEAWTMVDGKRMSSEVGVQSSGLTAKAGYAHVTWVDLTPGATAKIKDEMAKAAVVETRK